jgi:hypothetical protein
MAEQGKRTRGLVYVAIGATMLASGAFIVGYLDKVRHWHQAVLLAEFVLILLFAVFWAMQTVDLWHYTSRRQAIARQRAS